jgi:hypothetical protein
MYCIKFRQYGSSPPRDYFFYFKKLINQYDIILLPKQGKLYES